MKATFDATTQTFTWFLSMELKGWNDELTNEIRQAC